ncbi:unnamed protein product, partial [Musa banksii]
KKNKYKDGKHYESYYQRVKWLINTSFAFKAHYPRDGNFIFQRKERVLIVPRRFNSTPYKSTGTLITFCTFRCFF